MDDIEFPLFSDKEVLSTDKSAGHVVLPAAAITDLNTTTLPGMCILRLIVLIIKNCKNKLNKIMIKSVV